MSGVNPECLEFSMFSNVWCAFKLLKFESWSTFKIPNLTHKWIFTFCNSRKRAFRSLPKLRSWCIILRFSVRDAWKETVTLWRYPYAMKLTQKVRFKKSPKIDLLYFADKCLSVSIHVFPLSSPCCFSGTQRIHRRGITHPIDKIWIIQVIESLIGLIQHAS